MEEAYVDDLMECEAFPVAKRIPRSGWSVSRNSFIRRCKDKEDASPDVRKKLADSGDA